MIAALVMFLLLWSMAAIPQFQRFLSQHEDVRSQAKRAVLDLYRADGNDFDYKFVARAAVPKNMYH